MEQPFWKSLVVSYKVKQMPYDGIIPLLDSHPREIKAYTHIKTYMQMHLAAKCPSTGAWRNEIRSIHAMEYDSAVR